MSEEKKSLGATELYGLFLAGGRSERMGVDKAFVEYHGCPQAEYYGKLLARYCPRVFLSCRREQEVTFHGLKYSRVHDLEEYSGIGPAGGILSAMIQYPNAAWLILACDMPFVRDETVMRLLRKRDPRKVVTVFVNSESMIDPLCAVYEPGARKELLMSINKGEYSLQKILLRSDIMKVKVLDESEMINANTPDESREAFEKLAQGKKSYEY